MTLFILTLVLVVFAMALMGTGLLVARRPLQRGCGRSIAGVRACGCNGSKSRLGNTRCAHVKPQAGREP